jgi:polysaccharide export outer membrane protein
VPSEETSPSSPPLPPATFGPLDLPPSGYSPPAFKPQDSQQLKLYRLNLGDAITVNVTDFPEFAFSGIIDPEGNIRVPILGKISVVGLTTDEVESKIAYELGRRYLKETPEVIAFLTAPRSVDLTVLGEVVRPGYYTVAAGTPLNFILPLVGGTTSKADLRSIVVRRRLVDGTVLENKVDLYTPLIEGSTPPDFRLQGGDTVIVSKLEVGQDQGYDRRLIARTNLTQPTITVRVLLPNVPTGVALRNLQVPNGSKFLDIIASLPVTQSSLVNVDEVSLVRFDPDKGGIVRQAVNAKAAINGDFSQNVPLEDQDVIVVSRTLLGQLFAFFSTLTQPIRDVFQFGNLFSIYNELDRFFNINN